MTATPPSWRPDLTDPFDLVEEVARIVGYTRIPSVLPTAALGSRPDPRAAAAPPGRPHPGRGRLRRGAQLPVRRRGRLRRARPARPTTCAGAPSGWRTRSRARSRRTPRRCCPGLLKAAARNLGRGAPGVALFETGTVAFPADRGPAPIYGVEWRPTDDELAKLFEALPAQPLHLAVLLAGERERSGLVGPGPRRRLVRRDRHRPPPGRGAGRRGGRRHRRPRCPGTRAGAPGSRWAGRQLGHAGELHPRVCQAFGLPAAHARPSRSTSTS